MKKPVIAILFLLCPLILIAAEEDKISKIEKILKDTSYGNYWDRLDAVKDLGDINNQKSTALLIDLLEDKEPPIREAAVMELSKISNESLLKYLCEQAITKNPGKPLTKTNALWALRLMKNQETLPYMAEALQDNDPKVSTEAIEATGCFGELLKSNIKIKESLLRKLSHSNADVRYAASEALGVIGFTDITNTIISKLSDSSPEVRASLFYTLAKIESSEKAVPYLIKGLKDNANEAKIGALEALFESDKKEALNAAITLLNDKDWRIRASAIKVMGKIRMNECVEPLVARLKNEAGRLRYDIVNTLTQITGKSLGYASQNWGNWAKANKDNLVAKETPSNPKDKIDPTETLSVSRFFTIPVFGEGIVFIIDFSGSMKAENKKENKRRIDIAKEQLESALKGFSNQIKFNIILMSTEATRINKRAFSPKVIQATEQNKQKGLDFVNDVWDRLDDIKRGRGDMYDAIMEAFNDKETDTIFILSDGKPTYGEYIQPANIIEKLIRHNRFRRIAINTIITGEKKSPGHLMENIAQETNGICIKK
jgi:HEAT repeat protein